MRASIPLFGQALGSATMLSSRWPALQLGKLREKADTYGSDAQTGEFGDLFSQGVISA
ncbi:hypothetical protein NKH86_31080 [Mesorhizobium sp. M0913]|uniref:hypothetical protein n=1 Tax=Mesorhizobium sp. M0913 TaxID=2957026 RepID=UPI0033375CB7